MMKPLYLLIVLALLFDNMCSEQPLLKQSDSGIYTQVTSLNTTDAEIEAEQKWYQHDKVKYATIIASTTATAVYMCNPTLRSLSWLKSASLALLAYANDANARRGGGGGGDGGGFGSSSRRNSGGGFGSSSRRSGGKGFSSSPRKSGGGASSKSIKSHTGSTASSFSKKAKATHKSIVNTSKKSIKSRIASKSNLLSKGIKPANDNVLTLELGKSDRSKPGVESKIRGYQRRAKEGKLIVTDTKDTPRNTALTKKARTLYAEKYPKLDMSKIDMDHKQDLQLDGKDTLRNIAPLDRGVNRKLGAQIRQEIKSHDYSHGTPINRVVFIYPKTADAPVKTRAAYVPKI